MVSRLSQIPGARPARRRRRWFQPGAALRAVLAAPGRRRRWRGPRSIPWSNLAIAAGFLALGLYVWNTFWNATRVGLEIEGISDGAEITMAEADALEVRIRVDVDPDEPEPKLLLDGYPVDDRTWTIGSNQIDWNPGQLVEGPHELTLKVGRPMLDEATFTWTFTVDDTPPPIDVLSPTPPVAVCDPVTVTGRGEPGAELEADGEPLEMDPDGRFTLSWDIPPTRPIALRSRDRAGNETLTELVVPVAHPSTQAIHVSSAAWGYEPLRTHVLDIVSRGLVSAVELDLKDEGGTVGYDTEVDLAYEIGAHRPDYALDDAVATLDGMGVRVVGRIVAFRDPPLAKWAFENGHPDWVVQTPEGQPVRNYGGFTNVGAAEVRKYNIDIAIDAVDRGVDEILWDYVRRPEGPLSSMVFPGIEGSPSPAVVQFLAEAAEPIRQACAYQGASLFGVAARNPEAIAQPVPSIARHVDYIAPMLYPSHWVRGEYDVDHPNAQPGDIVAAALADFQAKAEGSGVSWAPWIQDFSIGIEYTPEMVRAQIDAAAELGVRSWFLWNARVTYQAHAIDPEIVDRPDGSNGPGPRASP